MASGNIIDEVSKPTFYTRVSYLALGVAQQVASEDETTVNHDNRILYAGRILRGEEDALMLSMHVVSSNPTIANTVETAGGDAVPDNDLQFALASIWDGRSNAYYAAVQDANDASVTAQKSAGHAHISSVEAAESAQRAEDAANGAGAMLNEMKRLVDAQENPTP